MGFCRGSLSACETIIINIMAFVPSGHVLLTSREGSSSFTNSRPLHISRRPVTRQAAIPSYCTTKATATNDAVDNETGTELSIRDVPIAPPPSTFYQAITQAQGAVDVALAEGHTFLEIEFPPLPTSALEDAAVGAYEVSDANVRLAVDFAKKYAKEGKRVALAFPDLIEKDRIVEQNNEQEEPIENIRLGTLKDAKKGSLIERLWSTPEVDVAVRDDDDIFIVLGASCQELPDVENLMEKAGSRPVILFNLKLDSARGDLGLPAFPRKDLHFRFLSTALPVYYLRTRTYSRSVRKPPYVVNYSGALFRVYPGPYQVLLDSNRGNYERLTTLRERPALGKVRDILTDGLNIEGLKGKKGSLLNKGYKSETWWEEDRTKAMSNNWRS